MASLKHKEVIDKFFNIIFDWNYKRYLMIGGYGSGKSYAAAEKIIFKCFSSKQKVLVVREVYDTLRESCFDLLIEILDSMDMIADESNKAERLTKVIVRQSPMSLRFPNGSRIIFKGMDKPTKVKSINGVTIVWLEECAEVKYEGYLELTGRLRNVTDEIYFILTCNPIAKESWVYNHFFIHTDDEGVQSVICNDEKLYSKKELVVNGTYYHHSTIMDNPFLNRTSYVEDLDELKRYDPILWRVAKLGRFGVSGTRVLPQLEVAKNSKQFVEAVRALPAKNHYYGLDFGFEESYNALISMAVDEKNKILYIYDEVYKNHITDDYMAEEDGMLKLKHKLQMFKKNKVKHNVIVADNEDPKAITYYQQQGYLMRGCENKFAGSRLSNTRKVKRFKQIIVSPKCVNTIRELKDLTYKKDAKGNVIYDQFTIDPHTFSAIWYALDRVTVADVKDVRRHSKAG